MNQSTLALDQLFGAAAPMAASIGTSAGLLGSFAPKILIGIGIAIGLLIAWGIHWILSLDWAGAWESVKGEN